MAFQTVFKRYELKYILTEEQKKKIIEAMEPYMQLDEYGRTTIRNIYFDTENYQLIRNSIESPVYKEKLRIRSYSRASEDSTVFVELKKKYDSVVYKRRLPLKESEAMKWLVERFPCSDDSQIAKEIDYFLDCYKTLRPKVFLTYEREAYYSKDESDFRVTFDDTILCRNKNVSLQDTVWGEAVLPKGMVLMEIKCPGGIPIWMAKSLSENSIYKTPFSKYGIAYKSLILPELIDDFKEVKSYV